MGSLMSICSLGELRNQGLEKNVHTHHWISDLLPRLLDITPASSLSFVLDTMGSMGEEINAVKIQACHIVEQRRGSPMEPVHYTLVPFHDPSNCGLARIVGGRKVQDRRKCPWWEVGFMAPLL